MTYAAEKAAQLSRSGKARLSTEAASVKEPLHRPRGYDVTTRPSRDHRNAMGPKRTPAASSANKANHPAGCPGPPAASSATPAPQPPSAERPNPTVECSASVSPR